MPALLTIVAAALAVSPATNPQIPAVPEIQRATVRLAIQDEKGVDFGSGTVVDVHGTRGLIVTCAHTFKHVKPGASVDVMIMSPETREELSGRLISFDNESDVGLVVVEGLHDVTPIPLAPENYRLRIGDSVVVAGCEGGRKSAEITKIVALDRFVGPANVEVAAMPPDGRSGGGLFNDCGELIGVCSGREPRQEQGIYGAVACVRQEMAKSGITSPREYLAGTVHGNQEKPLGQSEKAIPVARRAPPVGPPSSEASDRAQETRASERNRAVSATSEGQSDLEVVCVVRSKKDPRSASRVIILNSVSTEFLEALDRQNRLSGRQVDAGGLLPR